MKKLFLFTLVCLIALSTNAQRCAILEFRAGAGISQVDVDGISAIFITYFHPAGYTMVERTQIDKAIDEQGFQRTQMTENQMVRIGHILNVSKIVVGDVNIVMGQYNVDARVINVESGTIVASEGASFSGSSYRATMQSIAQKLASKIAIISEGTMLATSQQSSTTTVSKMRSNVEVVYGFLKVFPNEIGMFEDEPTSVIAQINKQAQFGYNNWRIPTNEELSLLRANGYLGNNQYMSRERKNGIVLLVSDGDDYITMQKKEEEQQRAKEASKIALKTQGWIDLGLPSGTLWKDKNEVGEYMGFYQYNLAALQFGDNLPTKEQFEELKKYCKWNWTGSGYRVEGMNGDSITLPAKGFCTCRGYMHTYQTHGTWFGIYWSSTSNNSEGPWCLYFSSSCVEITNRDACSGISVRLVKNP